MPEARSLAGRLPVCHGRRGRDGQLQRVQVLVVGPRSHHDMRWGSGHLTAVPDDLDQAPSHCGRPDREQVGGKAWHAEGVLQQYLRPRRGAQAQSSHSLAVHLRPGGQNHRKSRGRDVVGDAMVVLGRVVTPESIIHVSCEWWPESDWLAAGAIAAPR